MSRRSRSDLPPPAGRRESPRAAAAPSRGLAHARTTAPALVPPVPGDTLALALVVAAGLVAWSGALRYFFSADDFRWLAGARGLVPPPGNLSRWIPYRLFWSVANAFFGLDPLPYHAASLLAHLGAAGALYVLLRRRVAPLAAAVGATCYVVHVAHFDAVYWISAIGDPLATMFALAALACLGVPGRRRFLALPLFAVGLLCKESVALLPLAAPWVLPSDRGTVRRPGRDPAWLGLWAMSAVAVLALVGSDTLGLRSGESAAYRVGFGPNVLANLLSYAGWTLNAFLPTMRSFSDAVDPTVFGWGVAAIGLGLAAVAWRPTRERGALAGAAIFLLGLAPVLPLERHTYHYYLSSALAGAAGVVAAAWDVAADRIARGLREGLAFAVMLLLAGNGHALIRKVETFPFPIPGLRANSTVDRALIASHVIRDLGATPPPERATLVLWSPTARALEGRADSARWTYGERNVRAALYDGLGVRVFFPEVRDVRFTPKFEPAGDSVWYGVYRVDGSLRAAPAPELEEALGERP